LSARQAELKCGGDWQISAASAKMVSDLSLQANGTSPDLQASPQERHI
jgi:hypothetical protein